MKIGFARTKESLCEGLLSPRSEAETKTQGQRVPRSASLTSRAIALLARRDHSRAELARKLARHIGSESDTVELERVLDQLGRDGLLSDQRFAAGIARNRSRRFGDARIRHDLRRLGVADDLSAGVLAGLAGTEAARAAEVRAKRFAALPTSAAERDRQARFLQSRGFSLDSIYQVLRGRVDAE